MITKAHITRRASQEGVPAKTVERDYVLAHIVASIAALGPGSSLIFKGGTALRMCHFDDYRYSADLDFSVVKGRSLQDALDDISQSLAGVMGSIEKLSLTDHNPPRIAYLGPLGRERTLKLDLATDELVFQTESRRLLPRWPDLPAGASICVYTLPEVAAEKLRCVLQRLQCRDLFDLHLLFEISGVDPIQAAQLFAPKAAHRGFDPTSFAERYRTRIPQYKKRWERELSEHVPGDLPHFNEVERSVARHLRQAAIL